MPDKFGRYEIKKEIGRGGMATVFHAYDPRFERDVAIKVLPKEFMHDPQFRARFEREAKMIALLEHPAIVPVYDFGDEEGQPYIVMRYMSGGSLSEKIKESGALPASEVVQFFSRLAPALDAAHAKSITHRDLKPGNILYDQYGNAFLSDFGIARLAQTSGVTLTGGNILGTPAYMSPEQVQGDRELDGRSDIYAMGVILFQLLTGQAPYQADTPARVMMMHILEPVPHILKAKSDLPPAIQNIINQAMAKEPNDRFATAGEMAAALESIFASGTQPNRPPIAEADKTFISSQLKTQIGPPPITPPPSTSPYHPAVDRTPTPAPAMAAPAARRGFPIWALVIGGLAVLGLLAATGFGIYMLARQSAVAKLSTPTWTLTQPAHQETTAAPSATFTLPPPTDTMAPPTHTQAVAMPIDTDTPTPTITFTLEPSATNPPTNTPTPEAVVIGGADKIAFIRSNDVYIMNVDGTDLQRITDDETEKNRLAWLPDGSGLIYITGKCVKTVQITDGRMDIIACFENASYLDAFEISPDGSQVAISISHVLLVVPYDIEKLKEARGIDDLAQIGTCSSLAPFDDELIRSVRWAKDSKTLAFVFAAPVDGVRKDMVRVVDVATCYSDRPKHMGVDFPSNWFSMSGYEGDPHIRNFNWDGENLFALVGTLRNGGFGDLYVFHMDLYRADLRLNPIDGKCCYRDPNWSPDGRFLLFAYQELSDTNKIDLYYLQYGTMGTGVKYQPLPLPDDFFTNRSESPQPVARPAK